MRYHSLVVDEKTLPGAFLVCARSEDNEVMGMRLKHYPVFGVQFHPESIATEHGHRLMGNFIAQTKEVV